MTRLDFDHETVCGARLPADPSRRCVLAAGHGGNHRAQLPANSARTLPRPWAFARAKTCPECAERVMVATSVCRVCGHRFDTPPGRVRTAPKGIAPHISAAAVAAFACSMVGIWVVSIPLGLHARRAIDRSKGALTGRALGTAGVAVGLFDMIATLVLVIALVG
jgi:hypothetical protein